MNDRSKRTCAGCHFLTKVDPPGPRSDQEHVFSLNEEEREEVRDGNFDWYHPPIHLKCSKGVWDEGIGPAWSNEKWTAELAERDRSEECFFWPYTEGMALPAAEELQWREEDRRKFSERNRWVRRGAIAAIFAVLIDILFRIGVVSWLVDLLASVGI